MHCQVLLDFLEAETQSWILGGVLLHYAGDMSRQVQCHHKKILLCLLSHFTVYLKRNVLYINTIECFFSFIKYPLFLCKGEWAAWVHPKRTAIFENKTAWVVKRKQIYLSKK